MKKKSGPSAGIPRASGERDSPVGGFYPNLQVSYLVFLYVHRGYRRQCEK